MHFFEYLFCRLYWWNTKVIEEKDIPVVYSVFGLSAFQMLNVIPIYSFIYVSTSSKLFYISSNIIPTFKHPGFKEEYEWRLILLSKDNLNLKEIIYGNRLKRYEIPLTSNYITEIVLGPKCDIESEELNNYLKLRGFDITKGQIIKSDLPYR